MLKAHSWEERIQTQERRLKTHGKGMFNSVLKDSFDIS